MLDQTLVGLLNLLPGPSVPLLKNPVLVRIVLSQLSKNSPYLIGVLDLHTQVISKHLGLSSAKILLGWFSQNSPYPMFPLCPFPSTALPPCSYLPLLRLELSPIQSLAPTARLHCSSPHTQLLRHSSVKSVSSASHSVFFNTSYSKGRLRGLTVASRWAGG